MPAKRKRPTPPTRMVQLLTERKVEILAVGGALTPGAFEEAWSWAWETMINERAFPHNTEHRRQWRIALLSSKYEIRATFIGEPTMFGSLAEALAATALRLNVCLEPEALPGVIVGAIREGYRLTNDTEVLV